MSSSIKVPRGGPPPAARPRSAPGARRGASPLRGGGSAGPGADPEPHGGVTKPPPGAPCAAPRGSARVGCQRPDTRGWTGSPALGVPQPPPHRQAPGLGHAWSFSEASCPVNVRNISVVLIGLGTKGLVTCSKPGRGYSKPLSFEEPQRCCPPSSQPPAPQKGSSASAQVNTLGGDDGSQTPAQRSVGAGAVSQIL